MIIIKIDTSNDAFYGCNKWSEIGRILKKIASQCVDFEPARNLYDINGNNIGSISEVEKVV